MDFALSPELEHFRDSLRDWVDREIPKDYAREAERREGEYPFEIWDKLAVAGYHAVSVPREYGGTGGDIFMQLLLARGLARSLAGLTWVWGSTSFAGAVALTVCGTEKQKRRILPGIARGDVRVTIGFTEPTGGTDLLGGMRTTATKVDGGWVINGSKTWCTSAHVSDYILLIARTDLEVEKRHHGVSLFLLPAKSQGITLTPIPMLGMRALGSFELDLDKVFVPDELLLGEPNKAWYMMLPTLNNERVMLNAVCCGIIDGILEDAVAYAQEREAFGRKIGEFQAIQHYIADIAIAQRQTELMGYYIAWLDAEGKDAFVDVTMSKVIASEHAMRAAETGIQILGGRGFRGDTDMQRYWRDARLYRLSPVSNEMARNLLAERQGLPRSF
jgi:alkylation response protein AidB-like acyl-CoA dehydrogenase